MQPLPTTLGALRSAGHRSRPVREELRTNLLARLRSGGPLFQGILGYDETVIPALENALLCGHDVIFLGERGQAKTRLIRSLVSLLDEWMPEIDGSEVHDDPEAPISAYGRALLAERGDQTPIRWVHRDARYAEKLATPDVSMADLIGDVDPVKVAAGRTLADEHTIHFGLLPRTNRGIFCINELPDLPEKLQVGLFNVLEERDFQVKGYRVRLPLDVLVVASANPEDYTSRGRIITPLKDRYAAQIRTHYPKTRELELAVVRQEAVLPVVPGLEILVPRFMQEIVAETTMQARKHPDVNQASGVSVRMTIASYETLVANAVRRALRLGESQAVPRISDLAALEAAMLGKLELEQATTGRAEGESLVEIVQRATKAVFDALVPAEGLAPVAQAFDQGWKVEVSADMPATELLSGLDQIPGLREGAARLAGGDSAPLLAAAVEFVLEGLHLSNRLNKSARDGAAVYARR
jgi:magnesium chelatase subunit I